VLLCVSAATTAAADDKAEEAVDRDGNDYVDMEEEDQPLCIDLNRDPSPDEL